MNLQTDTLQEPAFLVGADVRGSRPLLKLDDSLQELALLAQTAGMLVVGQAQQHLHQIDPNTFIGSGKAEEIRQAVIETGAKVVVFDDELSPRHLRELEKLFGDDVRILDRSALILDIFAQHARTREGALQVELAQYEYRLPRLTRQWTHLARQAGGGAARGGAAGVGLRGPGETQLEVDRRDIRRRIVRLKRELEQVRQQRSQHRQQRSRAGMPVIALVGYTNAGKSTLLQAISGAEVYIADQLFATLDPLSRRIELPSHRQAIMTDTVGFIQKLPTTLIAAFRATLEEVAEADLLLHVVDAAHPNVLQHIETVEDTLAAIDVPPLPRILVWNKLDLCPDLDVLKRRGGDDYHAEVAVSARTGMNLPELMSAIESVLALRLRQVRLLFPYERGDLVAAVYELGTVIERESTPSGIVLTVHLSTSLFERFKDFQIGNVENV